MSVALGTALTTPVGALELVLDTTYTSTPPGTTPAGTPPWGTATFTDTGAGEVTLELSLTLQDPDEFVTSWFFNLDPAYDPTDLDFSGSGATVSLGSNAFQAPGDGFFDIWLTFPSGPPSSRFNNSDTITFVITCVLCTGFEADSFNFMSTSDAAGPLFHAAHVQGIGENATASAQVTGGPNGGGGGSTQVPAPASLALLGSAMTAAVGLVGVRRLRRKR
jgi:hypothetical protein